MGWQFIMGFSPSYCLVSCLSAQRFCFWLLVDNQLQKESNWTIYLSLCIWLVWTYSFGDSGFKKKQKLIGSVL